MSARVVGGADNTAHPDAIFGPRGAALRWDACLLRLAAVSCSPPPVATARVWTAP